MNSVHPRLSGRVESPVRLSVEPYISADYARAEKDRLWLKVWQVACREEEIPKPGDYATYDILDQSLIVLRLKEDEIVAYHNACRHRARRLLTGCGRARHIHCPYHGWQWNLAGENTLVRNEEGWQGMLDPDQLSLRRVKVERWGGFVWVNFDPDCEPLESYLEEVHYWLTPFEMEAMRYKWRKRMRFACNWKVVVEAFIEGYHGPVTHPQVTKYGTGTVASSSEGRHARLFTLGAAGGGIGTSVGMGSNHDLREIPYLSLKQQDETVWTLTTDTFLEAARQLPDLLPPDATGDEIAGKLFELARGIDRARGVDWPEVSFEHMANVGINWHVFPNTVLLPNMTFCLGFRVRPDGFDPDSCIMEVYALERYPEGQVPQTEWVETTDHSARSWPLLLRQDFRNMELIQQGMKSVSMADGLYPSPDLEAAVINLQRTLARYMDRAHPQPLEKATPG